MVAKPHAYTLQALADRLGLELRLRAGRPLPGPVCRLAALASAGADALSFYHNPRYSQDLRHSQAAAVILHPRHETDCPTHCLLSEQPYVAFARASQLFARPLQQQQGIHASALLDADVQLAANVSIGAHAVIGAGVAIGEGAVIGAHVVIGEGSTIGAGCVLYPNVTLYHDVHLGERCIVHAGAVLGADGFGFATSGGRHHKIAQLGGVRLGNDVEVGASSTIDRGALDDTVIEDGVKIDNQVQIAHNVRIGAHSVICGCSAIAGSSVIGKNCTIAGAVGVINHITICDGVTVTAMSLVNQNIDKPGVYSSGTGLDVSGNWRRNIVRFRQLDDMARRLTRLEQQAASVQEDPE